MGTRPRPKPALLSHLREPVRRARRTLLVAALVLLPAVSGAPPPAEADTPMPPAIGRADIALYVDAFRAAARDNWRHAHRLARRADDPLGATILQWWDYSRPGSTASFDEIARFMDERPDWPDQRLLQVNAEAAMADGVSDAEVIAWYHWRDPISAPGRLRYADALLARGEDERAAALVRAAWIEGTFSARDLRETYRRYRSLLRREDHIARLDRLVWANYARAARRMYRYVDEGHQMLAEARLTLRARQGGVDRAIQRVPRALRDHPGLVYERLRWRRAKGRDDDAHALLRSPPRELGPRPKLWWRERAILLRRALEDGQTRRAYALAAGHSQTAASTYSEAEWLAGWIALRFLDDARLAFPHFVNMHGAVTMPISRTRGAYWAGRAADVFGDRDGAHLWYERAAAYPCTFYGQLALAQIAARDAPLFGAAAPATEAAPTLNGPPLVAAVRFLTFLGRDYLAEPFYGRLSRLARNEADHAEIAALAHSVGKPDQAIRAAQQAARDGYVSIDRLFPLVDVPFARNNGDLEHALVLALIRQESRFDKQARSSAGALGLMQLMPRTARSVARSMGLSESSRRLTSSATHNIALGSRYLDDLIERYDGSYLLAVAAYNGGPRNVARWIAANGDPRHDADVDIIDWIEMIPIPETRNYVQRVLEGTQVYRWQLGRRPTASSLERDLTRGGSRRTVVLTCRPGDDGALPERCRTATDDIVLPVDRPDRRGNDRSGLRRRRLS